MVTPGLQLSRSSRADLSPTADPGSFLACLQIASDDGLPLTVPSALLRSPEAAAVSSLVLSTCLERPGLPRPVQLIPVLFYCVCCLCMCAQPWSRRAQLVILPVVKAHRKLSPSQTVHMSGLFRIDFD